MKQKKNIDNLLTGLLSGTISPEENEYLFHYLTKAGHQDEVKAWLQDQWEKKVLQTDEKADETADDTLFEKIRKQIENNALIRSHQQPVSQKWRLYIRYAAIFIIAFGSSWLIHEMTVAPSANNPVVNETVLYNEVLVPYGSKTVVVFPDSTKVSLNAGARFKYPTHYDHKTREVYLQGEGFFDVSHDEDHPFIVRTNGLNIKVLGTKFNLMANADDKTIEATLVEGTIEILDLKDAKDTEKAMKLKPGQKLTLQKEQGSYSVMDKEEETMLTIPKVVNEPVKIKNAILSEKAETVELSTAWTENRMVFIKERFEIVKTRLERWYGVEITVQDPEISDYRFTGIFDMETFEQAMSALSEAAQCDFKIDKAHVVVTKKLKNNINQKK